MSTSDVVCPSTRTASSLERENSGKRPPDGRAGLLRSSGLVLAIAVFLPMLPSAAEEFTIDFDSASPDQYLDRWMYPFNVTPGSRIQAPTFGAVGSEGFDERDGQFLLVVDSASMGIPTGLPSDRYQLDYVRLTLTEAVGGYIYDNSSDGFATYLSPDSPIYEPDADRGRPIELFGVGFRNGFERFGFPDGGVPTEAPIFSSASSFGPPGKSARNIYPIDGELRDVSNNIDSLNGGGNGFDPIPFAVGHASGELDPGDETPPMTPFTFEVDLTIPSHSEYIRDGLSLGQLGFLVTSLHSTGIQGEGDPFVNLATSNHFAVPGPTLTLSVSIVEQLTGDFDNDGALTSTDIDTLTNAILAGSVDERFDLNRDSLVDSKDHRYWIDSVFGTYVGDANLDKEFNSQDLILVFQTNEYEDGIAENSGWSSGDWNGDREFDTSDFVSAFQAGGYEKGPRSSIPIPEPTAPWPLVITVFLLFSTQHRALRRMGRCVPIEMHQQR